MMSQSRLVLWIIWGCTMAATALALDNGLGRVPQMGWNSWYDLTGDLNEQVVRETTDALVSTGLASLGYKFINLDDLWAGGRYDNGTIYADRSRFPSGTLKPIADYVHSKGLLFGTYTDRGTKTCGGRPGAYGHEQQDAQVYASWGVDYLKEDSCYAVGDTHEDAFKQYGTMRDALNKTGRPIFFSLCGWNPWYAPVGMSLGNSWRIGPDDTNWQGILKNIDINAGLAQYAGPGGWNDPCLLLAETDKGSLRVTQRQTRTQFNMWAIMASPLLISANIRNMSTENINTYRNREVIAVNQDPLGKQGTRVQGGDLAPTSSNTPAHTAACDSSDASQQWEADSPAKSYFRNKKSNLCLNVDDCGTSVIYFACVTSGGTCCGSDCYDNMKFVIQPNGTMTSPNNPGLCAQSSGNAVTLVPCPQHSIPSDMMWKYDDKTGLISVGTAGSERCLTTAAASNNGTNVWARQLHNGDVAMCFVNVGQEDTDVTCDKTCLQAAGLTVGKSTTIRDLWTNTTQTVDLTEYTAKAVPAEGGSVMLRLSQG